MLEDANYIVETSEVFQNEHIGVQENWINNVNSTAINEHDDRQEFVNSSTNQTYELHSSDPLEEPAKNTKQSLSSEATGITDSKTDDDDDDDDDTWCEVEDHVPGFTNTLLQEPDMTENVRRLLVLHHVKERDL